MKTKLFKSKNLDCIFVKLAVFYQKNKFNFKKEDYSFNNVTNQFEITVIYY